MPYDEEEAAVVVQKHSAAPIITTINNVPTVIARDDWTVHEMDHLSQFPQRPEGTVLLHDAASFIAFANLHGNGCTSIYISLDEVNMDLRIKAVLNDNSPGLPGWRDHIALFQPKKTAEWDAWTKFNKRKLSQVEFAHFLESNLPDINNDGDPKMPTASELLTFATKLEETRKVSFRSGVNLQNGLVQLSYIEEGDSKTQGNLELYKEFCIGIKPFLNGDAYAIKAFLRYSIDRNNGTLTFWYELQRIEKVFATAANSITEEITSKLTYPAFYGWD